MAMFFIFYFMINNSTYGQLSTKELPVSFEYKNLNSNVTTKTLPSLDMAIINQEDLEDEKNGVPPRFGYAHKVNYSMDSSGEWSTLANGDRIWRLCISIPEALSINLLYDKFWLPEGGKFFIYSYDKKHSLGAFTSYNNKGTKDSIEGFATGLIYSNKIVLEYYSPSNVIEQGIISVAYVIQGYRYINIFENEVKFGQSGNCQVNINCEEGVNWQNEKNAVALILVNGNRYCTGSLINNITNDNTPLFLTADHCLGGWANSIKYDAITNPNLNHWSFYWNYEAPYCSNPTTEPQIHSTVGATVKANNSISDFALLSLSEDPKFNSDIKLYYLGWDNSGSSGVGAVGIHHPAGDIKKIATLYENTNTTWNGNVNFWSHYWDQTVNGYSVTEGGSSGSPLINLDKHVIGQLYGGSSINCSNPSEDIAAYGKFSISWTGNGATDNRRKLQPWLDPNNTGATIIDGISSPYNHEDLYVRDNNIDNGDEPSNANDCMWASPDIWIEDANGNIVDNPHGNVEYKLCVRIYNKKNISSSGKEKLFLNWTKAGVDLRWNNSWMGNTFFNCAGEDIPKGGYIGNQNGITIPSIPANSSAVVKVTWLVPRAEDYANCTELTNDLWHFCLAARIHDGNTIPNENSTNIDMGYFVLNSNNVAWKNISILNSIYNRAVVSVSNPYQTFKPFRLSYKLYPNKANELLYKYADVYLTLSSDLFKIWERSNFAGTGFKKAGENKILLTGENAILDNLMLEPNKHYTIESQVNFFTQAIPENNQFTFDIIQYVNENENINLIGGERYIAIRDKGRDFKAVALEDTTIFANETVTFYANTINEDATYTWYNQSGDTIATGTELTTTPITTNQYKLEVVSDSDGFKDFDTIIAIVRNGAITSLSPNPATNQVTVSYRLASNINNAIIKVTNTIEIAVHTATISSLQTSTTLNVQNLVSGQYSVQLLSTRGDLLDYKNLVVQ